MRESSLSGESEPGRRASRLPCGLGSSWLLPKGARTRTLPPSLASPGARSASGASRFAKSRLEGLLDRPHCPPPRLYGPEIQAKIVVLACQSPESLGWAGQTHWSIKDLAIYIREHPELGLGSSQQVHRGHDPPGARRPPGAALTPGCRSATPTSWPRPSRSSSWSSTLRPMARPSASTRRPASAFASRPPRASQWPPAEPARREFEYVRNGTAALLAAFCVLTGVVHGIVRQQHRSLEFIELLRLLDKLVPPQQVIHLILDPVRLHCSAEVAVYLAYRPWRFRLHWLPLHASWLSFIEPWFSILSKKCLKRAELADFAAADKAITDFIATYDAHQAHPFTWKQGVKFYQRLKDKLAKATANDQSASGSLASCRLIRSTMNRTVY